MDNVKRGLGDLKPQNLFGKDDQEHGFAEVVADNAVSLPVCPIECHGSKYLFTRLRSLSSTRASLWRYSSSSDRAKNEMTSKRLTRDKPRPNGSLCSAAEGVYDALQSEIKTEKS